MNFRLGNCSFETENWSIAAASFQRAAQADKSDAASAFNAGLSLARLGFASDPNLWFREALARNPGPEPKTKIENALH